MFAVWLLIAAVPSQVDTPMGIQPLPPGKSASDHLIQFPEKSGGEKEGEAIDNFG